MAAGESGRLGTVFAEPAPAPPCAFVLFGVTGDLAARKIVPALHQLVEDGLVGENVFFVGVGRRDWNDDKLRDELGKALDAHARSGPPEASRRLGFLERWHYVRVHADSAAEYPSLCERLGALDSRYGTGGSRLFYLATTPALFPAVATHLGDVGLCRPAAPGGAVRLVVEKPFGSDLATARELNNVLLRRFDERQIYRIDHYLGKETVQNLLVFRFANAIFEPLLNRDCVARVEISTAEALGMEGRRGPYFEQIGALRDMIQNHMLQLVALVAMEAPTAMTAEAIRDEKAKVLRAIKPLTPDQVPRRTVRGQYTGSEGTPAYTGEEGVAGDSQVETFAAVKLFIDNWRWAGVPFYLRTGKRLAKKASQVLVVFKREPVAMFDELGCDMRSPNRLAIRIYPDEGINLVFDSKVPGARMLMRPVKMDFRYGSSFESASPEAYEHLLLDAFVGDPTLFIRNDEVESAWRFVDSIRCAWDVSGRPPLLPYAAGSSGPAQAESLFGDPYDDWHAL